MCVIDWKRTPGNPIECSRRWSNSRVPATEPASMKDLLVGGEGASRDRAKREGRREKRPGARSVAEVAAAGEDHRRAGLVYRRVDLGIPPRPARLDERGDSRVERDAGAVGEREERVARKHCAVEV